MKPIRKSKTSDRAGPAKPDYAVHPFSGESIEVLDRFSPQSENDCPFCENQKISLIRILGPGKDQVASYFEVTCSGSSVPHWAYKEKPKVVRRG